MAKKRQMVKFTIRVKRKHLHTLDSVCRKQRLRPSGRRGRAAALRYLVDIAGRTF